MFYLLQRLWDTSFQSFWVSRLGENSCSGGSWSGRISQDRSDFSHLSGEEIILDEPFCVMVSLVGYPQQYIMLWFSRAFIIDNRALRFLHSMLGQVCNNLDCSIFSRWLCAFTECHYELINAPHQYVSGDIVSNRQAMDHIYY